MNILGRFFPAVPSNSHGVHQVRISLGRRGGAMDAMDAMDGMWIPREKSEVNG